MTLYPYIGPAAIRERTYGEPAGTPIVDYDTLAQWLRDNPETARSVATFVVMTDGTLRLAPQRSEHVACASREPVLTAGELTIEPDAKGHFTATSVTNQSTGYAPEPTSYDAISSALDRLGVARPDTWTAAFVFRRCPRCAQLTLIKELVYECAVCGEALPIERNL